MDAKSAGILGVCIIVGALAVSLMPRFLPGPAANEAELSLHRIHSPDGDLVVDYTVETSPTTAEGGQITGVTDIEFHEAYVVVKDKAGRGRVFFGGRTGILSCSEGKH